MASQWTQQTDLWFMAIYLFIYVERMLFSRIENEFAYISERDLSILSSKLHNRI